MLFAHITRVSFFVTSNFEFVIVFYTRQSVRSCDRIIITLALFLCGVSQRYTWHEYIMAQMTAVSQTGKPVNRPLWFDFPHDPMTWDITTSYMFGDTMLVAPVTDAGVTVQTAYVLPCTPLPSLLFLYVHACIVDCFFPKLLFVFLCTSMMLFECCVSHVCLSKWFSVVATRY